MVSVFKLLNASDQQVERVCTTGTMTTVIKFHRPTTNPDVNKLWAHIPLLTPPVDRVIGLLERLIMKFDIICGARHVSDAEQIRN